MRIAYLLYLDIEKYDGVANKVISQVQAWNSLGFKTHLFCIVPRLPSPKNSFSTLESLVTFFVEEKTLGASSSGLISGWVNPNKTYHSIMASISSFNPDMVYYRNSAYTPILHSINKRYITVCEINTDEFSEFKHQAVASIKYFLRFIHFLVFKRFTFTNVNAIVGVTFEIINVIKKSGYNGPCIVVPNSIDISKYSTPVTSRTLNKIPKLVFIGTPGMKWHGVDRIVKIASKTVGRLNFHIIGYSRNEFPEASQNVEFHGILPANQTKEVIMSCDIGIGTMALYRKRMDEACPLKVRECLSCGLPMILAYEDTAFINPADFSTNYPDFILKIPNHQNEIEKDVDEILKFSEKYVGRVLTRDEIAPFIDSRILEKKRVEFFKFIHASCFKK